MGRLVAGRGGSEAVVFARILATAKAGSFQVLQRPTGWAEWEVFYVAP
jgi:hypothetical protein